MTLTVPLHAGQAVRPAPVLELIDVVKEYPGDPPVVALAGVDLRSTKASWSPSSARPGRARAPFST